MLSQGRYIMYIYILDIPYMEDVVTYGGRYTSIGSGQLLFDLELIERTGCDDLLATHHMLVV